MAKQHLAESTTHAVSCFHVWEVARSKSNTIGYRCARCRIFREVDDIRSFQDELTPEITERELSDFIREVESGRVVLRSVRKPSQVYIGRVEYYASNGWRVVVFNDRDNWDYFDRFETPDGRIVTLATMPETIQSYRPDWSVVVERYEFADAPRFQRIRVV